MKMKYKCGIDYDGGDSYCGAAEFDSENDLMRHLRDLHCIYPREVWRNEERR